MQFWLWVRSLLTIGLILIVTSCGQNSDSGVLPSNSTFTDNNKFTESDDLSVETIIPGETECDVAGDVSPDGKYVCAGRGAFYWVSLLDLATNTGEDTSGSGSSDNSNNGYWTTNCINVEVPNPNYDGRPTDSRGHIQWPTIKTQQCSQVWVKK